MSTTDWLTASLVVITAVYAWLTYRITQHTAAQTEALTRPFIAIGVLAQPKSCILFLRIANTGHSAAQDLQMSIDRDFYQFGQKEKPGGNIRALSAFTKVIETFPPGSELVFALAQDFVVYNKDADPAVTPTEFRVEARYRYGAGKKILETTVVDLKPYLKTWTMDPLLNQLEDLLGKNAPLTKAIRDVAKEMKERGSE